MPHRLDPDVSPICVIWNPSAGQEHQNAEARELFAQDPTFSMCITETADEARRSVETAIARGTSRIIAAGGDGTIHAVADILLETSADVEFGVLPLGTGNDLARSLGIPLVPSEAIEILRGSRAVAIDVLELKSESKIRYGINMVTGGNTGKFMSCLTDELKQRWGPFCYLRGAIDIIQDLEIYPIEVTCDGGPPERFEAVNVFVANGRTSGGGLTVSPDAKLDDGLLDVIVIKDGPAGEIAELAATYAFSDYREHELIVIRSAKRVTFRTSVPMPGSVDGDPLKVFPSEILVRRSALKAIVGPDDAAVGSEVAGAHG